MCEKNIMKITKRSEMFDQLHKDNRIHIRFLSEDFEDLPGYRELIYDIALGDLKPAAQYHTEMRNWLQYHEIDLNEIEDDRNSNHVWWQSANERLPDRSKRESVSNSVE